MQEKEKQREQGRAARKALTGEEKARYSGRICETLMNIEQLQDANTICSYMCLQNEVDMRSVHMWLLSRGKTLAAPVVHGEGNMTGVRIDQNTSWKKGEFNNYEPSNGEEISPKDFDVVLVPCVAFDEQKNRLGQGGGYYDRFLSKCGNAYKIAVAFDAQKLNEIYTEPNDIPVDMVVTENCIIE